MFRVLPIAYLFSILLLIHASRKKQSVVDELLSKPLFEDYENYNCAEEEDSNIDIENFHYRGTSLGGFLVLEPWITPSLFYQFLGASEKWGDEANKHIGLDSLTFCKALGSAEANRQLRNHWKTWVTEEQIANLAASNIDTVRIPVADWMFEPYGPFEDCFDGALEELDRAIDLCDKYKMRVLIDLHALRGSQNGLDNSGDTGHYEWVGKSSTEGAAYYRHWDIRGGDWAGDFNPANNSYNNINVDNLMHSLRVVRSIVDRYREHRAVIGLEPVNEPWIAIPIEVIREYYWRSYRLIRALAPHWVVFLHDSFRLTSDFWGPQSNFLAGCAHYVVDTHIYQAWAWRNPMSYFVNTACKDGDRLAAIEALGVPVVVGEWSLATDNCAMWLNGLNDNVPGYPKVQCNRIPCPAPYMGAGVQPNAPPDPRKYREDPFGTGGESYVEFGTCPVDALWPDEINVVRRFAYAQLHAYDLRTHGFFFWNFRTEFGTRWNFQEAVKNQWIPTNWRNTSDNTELRGIAAACDDYYHSAQIDDGKVIDDTKVTSDEKSKSFSMVSIGICAFIFFAITAFIKSGYQTPTRQEYQVIPDEDISHAA